MKILILVFLILISACDSNRDPRLGGLHFPYVIDMYQGNIINSADVSRLYLGMKKHEVKDILGEPLLVDTFHKNRWDYVQIQRLGKQKPMRKAVSLFFDNNDLLVSIRR